MPKKTKAHAAKSGKDAGQASRKAADVKERVFKTKWFNAEAASEGISDNELCEAVDELKKGQGVDLGGGVWKKRLNKNMHRSIVLAKGKKRWIYAYLFHKNTLDNIEGDELADFRKLAKSYEGYTEDEINVLVEQKRLVEICHARKTSEKDGAA